MRRKEVKMLKIVAPINKFEELQSIIDAGADEIYFGYLDKRWSDKYDAFTGNRRENYEANISDRVELKKIIYRLNELSVKYAVTMNDRYSYGQYSDLRKVLDVLADEGVENIIVADIGLVMAVREWGYDFRLQISTGGGTFNHLTADFYKATGNVSRIILPRQLTIDEINSIVDDSIEYEVFGIYGKDPYIDAFCRFHHGINRCVPGLGPCGCMRVNESNLIMDSKSIGTPYKCLNMLYVDGCAACAFPKLDHSKIGYVKVVGRAAKTARKTEAIVMMKKAVEIACSSVPYEEKVLLNKRNFISIYRKECEKNNCYFAE